MYGKPVPPTFDLSKSTFPVAIFSGENDYCVHPEVTIMLNPNDA